MTTDPGPVVREILTAGPDAVTYVLECLTWRLPDDALTYLAEWKEQQS